MFQISNFLLFVEYIKNDESQRYEQSYNAQDVILMCEIIENRFQLMQDKCGFNTRKRSCASTLSDSIQRDLSKIIISLPTNNEHVELFEEVFSAV